MAEATIDDFKKLEIRVGEIKSAQPIEGSDNLLLLKIDIGEEERQIVSGIKKSYKAEELLGKSVIVLANLKTAKIRGFESQGMILAAPDGELWSLLTTDRKVKGGGKIS